MEQQYIDSDGQLLRLVIYEQSGGKYYYNSKKQFHRLDGPAITWSNGSYWWIKEGKKHRIGGPASHGGEGNYNEWFINNKLMNVYYIYG